MLVFFTTYSIVMYITFNLCKSIIFKTNFFVNFDKYKQKSRKSIEVLSTLNVSLITLAIIYLSDAKLGISNACIAGILCGISMSLINNEDK